MVLRTNESMNTWTSN